MTDLIASALRVLEKEGAQFGDVRREARSGFVVRIANGRIMDVRETHRSGWGLRAFVDGAWGYASGTGRGAGDVATAARRAVAIAGAGAAAGVTKGKLRRMADVRKSGKPRLRIDPNDVSVEDKVGVAQEIDRAMAGERIASTASSLIHSDIAFELANTWGADVRWREVRFRLGGQAVASEGDRKELSFDAKDATGGWEFVRSVDPAALGAEIGKEARERLRAVRPPGGLQTVILDPDSAGLLAHEVMGHASEGDEVVKRRSFLTDVVGKRVGSDLVTMYDDGTVPGAYGSLPFDSEGTPARRTTIIDRGVYKGHMHSLESAGALGVRATGNGRAQDFGRRVWVRMTNTYFAPGKDREEDLVADTKQGILTKGWISGMEDVVGGGFQAVTQSGFLVRKGEVGERVRGMTLTGKALEILKSVDRTSRELRISGGSCGKGEADDFVPVGSGGPFMRAKVIVGGG